MEKIKVLIADDHRVVREGLASILKTKDDINVLGEAQDGAEAVEKARTLLPDVILMDVRFGLHTSLVQIAQQKSFKQEFQQYIAQSKVKISFLAGATRLKLAKICLSKRVYKWIGYHSLI